MTETFLGRKSLTKNSLHTIQADFCIFASERIRVMHFKVAASFLSFSPARSGSLYSKFPVSGRTQILINTKKAIILVVELTVRLSEQTHRKPRVAKRTSREEIQTGGVSNG